MLLWYMVSNDVRHSCCEFSAKGGRDFIAVRQLATRDVKFYWQVLPCLNSALDGGWMDSIPPEIWHIILALQLTSFSTMTNYYHG